MVDVKIPDCKKAYPISSCVLMLYIKRMSNVTTNYAAIND